LFEKDKKFSSCAFGFYDMSTIVVLGAGRSSAALIDYLLAHADAGDWRICVADLQPDLARERIHAHPRAEACLLDMNNESMARELIGRSDVVISLLPPHWHTQVARYCLDLKKHLITASYVSDEMRLLHADALNNNLLFLNECGLDPGIDHMSAMEVISRLTTSGGRIISFESFTGGLIAPSTDPGNPWRYKFTWNPRNVVMAGQGTARYLELGQLKFIPYSQLFRRITRVHVPGIGELEGYANRDSLMYREIYGLHDVNTLLRGTLRYPHFCSAWHVLVQLGVCDDTYEVSCGDLTHAGFVELFLPAGNRPVEERLCRWMGLDPDGYEMERLRWSGFFSAEPVGLERATPARITEHILNKRWALHTEDRDMIVMWHRFRYVRGQQMFELQSSLVVEGRDAAHTAMATTVGLPLGIATRLLLEGRIVQRGVAVPVAEEIYRPVLEELKQYGIIFREEEVML
jgi:saccharopine dehydrogenase-like NADP-dependent oxidoreductase